MKNTISYFLFFIVFFFASCGVLKDTHKTKSALIVEEGFVDCFEKGLMTNGKPTWCEASAVLYLNDRFFFATDKEMPDERTSLFYVKSHNGEFHSTDSVVYIKNSYVKKAIKFEDLAVTPDGKTVFLTTGFDRTKSPKSKEWDGYNSLIYWHSGYPEDAKVVSENGSDSTSISLRPHLSNALSNSEFPEGMPYFKIEGLAVTNSHILFGIREYGRTYEDFSYAVKLISVSYEEKNGIVTLKNDFHLFADIDVSQLNSTIPEKVAISSIEYNKYENNFYLLTSFEDGENVGAYLWKASWKDLQSNKMKPIFSPSGAPLKFTHKAEDLTILSKNRIFIIHDDDRLQTTIKNQVREPHQSAYSIVETR